MIPLSEICRVVKFTETEGRGWRERDVGNSLMGAEFQFCEMKKVLEMSGGHDFRTK